MKKEQILSVACTILFVGMLTAQNTITVTTGSGSKKGSLAVAIEQAQDGDIIVIDDAIAQVVVDKEIIITKSVTVDGKGKTIQVKKPMKSDYRLFTIGEPNRKDVSKCTVTFKNCRLLGGNTSSVEKEAPSTSYGACFFVLWSAKFNLDKCVVENTIASYGPAIFNSGGDVMVKECEFIDNSCNRNGGAIYDQRGKMTVVNSQFLRNSATAVGGAIGVMDASLIVKGCTFKENITNNGGALGTFNKSKLRVESSVFENNQASNNGGAFFGASTDRAIFIDSRFLSNTASKQGGAMYSDKSIVDVAESTFNRNMAESNGGAVSVGGVTRASFDRCFFEENLTRGNNGGAISNRGVLTLVNSTLYKNEALGQDNSLAGGVYTANEAHIINCSVIGNLGNSLAGGIVNDAAGSLALINNLITHNYRGTEAMDVAVKNGKLSGDANITMKIEIGAEVSKMGYKDPVIFTNQKLYKKVERRMPIAEMNGGKTKTIAIEADGIAAATGLGDDRIPTEDQRGEKRSSPACIGAFEAKTLR